MPVSMLLGPDPVCAGGLGVPPGHHDVEYTASEQDDHDRKQQFVAPTQRVALVGAAVLVFYATAAGTGLIASNLHCTLLPPKETKLTAFVVIIPEQGAGAWDFVLV